MGLPAATGSSTVVSTDTHVVMVPSGGGPIPTPLPHAFAGRLSGGLIASVTIAGQAAAVVGSSAANRPGHVPTPPGASFQRPPADRGQVAMGSATVRIGGQPAARHGDAVTTCNDPSDLPIGRIIAAGTVRVG
jgi:uncharacterized Zn-binding protein involved in type VI secretion